jgi:hypothetical protein
VLIQKNNLNKTKSKNKTQLIDPLVIDWVNETRESIWEVKNKMQKMIEEQQTYMPGRVRALYEFGLDGDMINYLVRQEQKKRASLKWQKY